MTAQIKGKKRKQYVKDWTNAQACLTFAQSSRPTGGPEGLKKQFIFTTLQGCEPFRITLGVSRLAP